MRVAILGPASPLRGGIAAHTAVLQAALRADGHEVTVHSYRRMYPAWLFPGTSQVVADAVTVGDHRLVPWQPWTWPAARRSLRYQRPEIVVVQWWHPLFAPCLRFVLTGVRSSIKLFVCHNARPHEYFPGARALVRFGLGAAEGVLCHSYAAALDVQRLRTGTALEICAMPSLIALGDDLRARRTRIRDALGWNPDAVVALFVGHIRRYKGIETLLEAWDRAVLPEAARLVIAGESYLGAGRLAHLVAQTNRSDSIVLLDRYVDDDEIRDLLAVADLFVLPHRAGSQSGTLPLALEAGLRVIASDAGGIAEGLATADGHHVVRHGDVAAFAAALTAAAVSWDASRSSGAPRRASEQRRPSAGSRLPAEGTLAAACVDLALRVRRLRDSIERVS